MNSTELFAAVRFYLNRNMPNNDIQRLVDAATGKMNVALRDHPRNLRVGGYVVPAGETLLPLPYDILSLRSIMRGTTVLKQYPPTVDFATVCRGTAGYVDRGNCAEFTFELPEDTKYRVEYRKALDQVALGKIANWVLEFFPDVYLYQVLKEAAVALKDRENGPVWAKEADSRLSALVLQGWNQNIAAAPISRVAA